MEDYINIESIEGKMELDKIIEFTNIASDVLENYIESIKSIFDSFVRENNINLVSYF